MKDPFDKAARPPEPGNKFAVPAGDAFPVSHVEQDDAARLQRILDMISVAEAGKRLVDFLKERDIKIVFQDALPQGSDTVGICLLNTERIGELPPYRFQLAKPVIHILRGADETRAAMALIHEGRHAMQAESGQHPLCRYLSQEDFKTYLRVAEADAGSFTILTAMKIFMAGGTDKILRHSVRTKADDETLGTLLSFANQYGPAVAEEPLAQRGLFDAWFRDAAQVARYDAYSDACWQGIDATVRGIFGFTPFPPALTAGDLRGIGDLSGGANYLEAPGMPDFAKTCGLAERPGLTVRLPKPPAPGK